jgi:RNA polymerase sigma-70 factor (ECF subfamily)
MNRHTDNADGFFGWVTTLVHTNRARLVRLVRREGVRADDALDCVQEAFFSFLSLAQARLLVNQPEDSARMLSVLARNIARNRRRRHDYARPHMAVDASVEQIASEAESADDLILRAERHALMLACIATLDEIQRAVVRLRLLDELPGENVAKQIGVTPGHVAVLLFRAKQELRQCVDSGPTTPPVSPSASGSRRFRRDPDIQPSRRRRPRGIEVAHR